MKTSENFPYELLDKNRIISRMNELGSARIPFLFIVDFRALHGYVIPEPEINPCFVRFRISPKLECNPGKIAAQWKLIPVSAADYKPRFDFVKQQINLGNSFLTNLTQPTEVETNLSLEDLYRISEAKYKLWLRGGFTVFSPETFVRIQGRTISSFPMKGTIDATIPHAEKLILDDAKEKAEHATIVDLIRNDLSRVADQVEVKRYRYVEKIATNKKDLLQVSSEISGVLPDNYRSELGRVLMALLPAGSISGAPKHKTLEIIDEAEGYERGFYTGVFGFFDGENLDSGVMIRFVEQAGEKLVFKSGGGITARSVMENEYKELIQKVYVPVH
ncbi:MAG TPA: aminodeoxychorismate synthase component I [Paludibacter sp.]|nr:aminodeoxychorismate synthase component I [Paludibacter sp.]